MRSKIRLEIDTTNKGFPGCEKKNKKIYSRDIFYWTVWCFLVPLSILKKDGVASLFKEKSPLFRKSNWLPTAVLILIIVITGIIKWNAISHSIGGILDVGGVIAPSIFVLFFQ